MSAYLHDVSQWAFITFLSTYALTIVIDLGRAAFEIVFNRLYKSERDVEVLSPKEVAFVIPCHNSEDVIEGTIKTLPPEYTAFCVENASSDDTEAKIKELAEKYPAVKLVVSPLKGKIRAVLYGVKAAMGAGCTHFVLVDDDIEWPDFMPVEVHGKDIPNTALPVVPTQAHNWIHAAQVIEYQMMVIGKRAQAYLGNVIMTSGAAGVYRIDTFFEAMKEHDGDHIGDDLQCSYIHHCKNMRIDLYSKAVVRTHPPMTIKEWWKQRAKRWEISPLRNVVWTLKVIFGSGQGWWIKLIAGYRLAVAVNDVARCISFPVVLFTNPVTVMWVWVLTYISLIAKVETYYRFYSKYMVKWDKTMWFLALTYPLYGSLSWVSRVWAVPQGLVQIWKYQVGTREASGLRPLVEELVSGTKQEMRS